MFVLTCRQATWCNHGLPARGKHRLTANEAACARKPSCPAWARTVSSFLPIISKNTSVVFFFLFVFAKVNLSVSSSCSYNGNWWMCLCCMVNSAWMSWAFVVASSSKQSGDWGQSTAVLGLCCAAVKYKSLAGQCYRITVYLSVSTHPAIPLDFTCVLCRRIHVGIFAASHIASKRLCIYHKHCSLASPLPHQPWAAITACLLEIGLALFSPQAC